MTVSAIRSVSVFDGDEIIGPATLRFHASPGEVLSTQTAEDGTDTNEPLAFDTVIEGRGCTLVPAFIDSSIDTAAADSDLQLFASFGISTVLDMSSNTPEIEAMRAASDAEFALPSYLASGTVATAAIDIAKRLYALREIRHIRTPAEAEPFVVSRITGPNQADYIKVLVDLPGLDEEILRALVNAAHRHGKMAIAHATQTAAYSRALESGFDVITAVPLDGIIDDETANGMATRGVACIPTLGMAQNLALVLHHREGGPGELLSTATPASSPTHDFNYALINVKKLYDAGVSICAGSDANQTSPMPIKVGEGLHDELKLLVRAGLSNLDALRAATVVPAAVFGLRDRGSLKPGHRADMVLLEGNPLQDINATRRICKVWVQGIEVVV